jgi:hypothetical protein
MELVILSNDNLEHLGLIDNAISVIWNRKYFTCGDFSIEVEATPYYINLIKKNYFIIRQDVKNEVGIIETISYTKDENNINKIIFTGRFAQSLLARRIIWDSQLLNGDTLEQLQALINDNAINPSDKSRQLVSNINKVALIGNYIERPTDATIKLQAINGDILIRSTGKGRQGNYLREVPFLFTISENTQLVTDDYAFSFGELIKNPFTNQADSIAIKGNKYIRKKNNVLIKNLKDDLTRRIKNSFKQVELLYEKADWNSEVYLDADKFYSGSLGILCSEDLRDFGVSLGRKAEGVIFSDYADIVENKEEGNYDRYFYTVTNDYGTFLVFANLNAYSIDVPQGQKPNNPFQFYKHFQAQVVMSLSYLEEWNTYTKLIYTKETPTEEDTGITVDMIPDNESYYSIGTSNPCTMLLECTTRNLTQENYLDFSKIMPDCDAYLYEFVKGENLLSFVESHLQTNGMGVKAEYSRDKNKITFSFFQGKNRTRTQTDNRVVLFSRDLDTLIGYEVTESTQGKNNVIRITGKAEETEQWTETGTSSGLNRFETFEDVGDIVKFSAIDYIRALQSKGGIALQGFSVVIGAEIDADLYKYRIDYDIGDLVTVDIRELSIQYHTRILEVCESYDNTGYKVTLVLGE